jgi:anhydro-N-acetylmuramic acid kinase
VEHIATQIANLISNKKPSQILCTGGGANNRFLIKRIGQLLPNHQIIVPDKKIVEYKEALIFAFLGVLRMNRQANCLKSVTGASSDNTGGAVYIGR